MLKDKVAIVTGASRGIGACIAKTLAANGAKVVVNYQGNAKAAEEVVNEICKQGGWAMSYQCDVADFSACQEFVGAIADQLGRIDILVNNAGITRDGLLMAMKEEDFDRVVNTNLKGSFNCMKFVSRIMLKQKAGKIINLSSVSGVYGNAGQTNYSASKAGIIGLTKSAAKELGAKGICVNAIAPGFIVTEMTEVLSDAVKEKIMAGIPMKRLGKTQDVADLALFLAGPGSDYITGQVIGVDGGM